MPPGRCCRSTPRCRRCPVRVALERTPAGPTRIEARTPAHMRGVPESLWKYEPLLRRSWEQRQSEAAPAARPAA
jgi:hypothetical protein